MSTESTPGRHRAPRTQVQAQPKRANKWLRGLTALVSLCVMTATAASGTVVAQLNANIITIDDSEIAPDPSDRVAQAPTDTSAMNLLLMGSDSRAGQGKGFGTAGGARSDTTLLVHLYEGRRKALVVSIPRDTEVTIPPCKNSDGQQFGTWTTKFNAAFAIGGPICTIKTIKAETGITINHFIVVDFKGFKNVVNALGGVDVCLSTPAYDPKTNGSGGSGLNLPAGWSHITGDQALAFVRARETLGDGSDLSRIQRQQEFLSSMIRGIESSGMLHSPTTVLNVLNNITSSMAVSPKLASVQALSELALSMANLKPADINFVTTPYVLKGDGNVHWTAETDKLWKAIKADQPYGKLGSTATPSPSPSATDGAQVVTPPSEIHVTILNGSGNKKLGSTVANLLKKQGFKIDKVSTGKATSITSVRYNKAWLGGAQTLAYAAQTESLVVNNKLTRSITLWLGSDFTTIRKVVLTTQTAPDWSKSVNAGVALCSQGNGRVKK